MRSPQSRSAQRLRSALACPSVLGFGVSWLLPGPHQTPLAGLVAVGAHLSLLKFRHGYGLLLQRSITCFRDPIRWDVTIALTFGTGAFRWFPPSQGRAVE